jgi:hypothetical protein
MSYRVLGLEPESFEPLFALSDADLRARGVERVVVESKPSAPCRISLDDAEPGETVLLLSYLHQPAATPYHQQGPIFVRQGQRAYDGEALAPALARRTLSLRGFDAQGMMQEAEVTLGADADGAIARLFANPAVNYIQAHYASRGCYAARIERV